VTYAVFNAKFLPNSSRGRTGFDSTIQSTSKQASGVQLGNPLVTTSYGSAIPIIFGKGIVPGFPIWSGPITNNVVVTTTTTTQTVSEKNVSLTGVIGQNQATQIINSTSSLAVGFGVKAPGAGRLTILRLWVNSELVYDITGNSSTVNNGKYNFTLYDGSETQMPDPLIVADKGADIPAFRGLAYAVFNQFPLADSGGTFPSIMAELSSSSNLVNPVTPFLPNNTGTPSYQPWTYGVDWTQGLLYLTDGTTSLDTYSLTGNDLQSHSPISTGMSLSVFALSLDKSLIYASTRSSSNTIPLNLFTPNGLVVGTFGVDSGGISSDATHLQNPNYVEPAKGSYGVDEYVVCGTSGSYPNNQLTILERVGYAMAFHSFYGSSNGLTPHGTGAAIGARAFTNGVNKFFDPAVMQSAPVVDTQIYSMAYWSSGSHIHRLLMCKNIPVTTETTKLNTPGTTYTAFPVLYLPRIAVSGMTPLDNEWTTVVGTDQVTDLITLAANEYCWYMVAGPPDDPWLSCMINNDTLGKTYIRKFDTIFNAKNYVPVSAATINASALTDLTQVFNVDIGFHYAWVDASFQVPQNSRRDGSPIISVIDDGGGGTNNKLYSLNMATGEVILYDNSANTFVDSVTPSNVYTFDIAHVNLFDPATLSVIYPVHQGAFGNPAPFPGRASVAVIDDGSLPLGTLLQQYCLAAGYQLTDIDITGMDNSTVIGSIINVTIDLQSLLGQVCELFRVNVVESAGKIKFSKRPRGSSLTLDFTLTDIDLAPLTNSADDGTLQDSDRNPSQGIPNAIQVDYIDYDNLCAIGEQYFKRTQFPFSTTPVVTTLPLSVPIVMHAADALYWAAFCLFDITGGTTTSTMRLGQKHLAAEPGDVFQLTRDDGKSYIMKIEESTLNGDLSMSIVARTFSQYMAQAQPSNIPGLPRDKLVLPPRPVLYIIDNLLLDPSQDPGDGSQIAYSYDVAAPATISRNVGNVYGVIDVCTQNGQVGVLTSALPARPYNVMWQTDTVTTFTFTLSGDSSQISSISNTDFLNGVNTLIVGTFGRWEVILFQNVTHNANGSLTVSNLLRGRRGTDTITGTHQIGDTVLWSPFSRLIFDVSELNSIEQFKTVALGLSDVNADYLTWKSKGGPLMPWAPSQVAAAYSSSDIVLTWNRRTRLASELHDGDGTTPLGEASELYSVDIYKAGVVVRTINGLTSPTATYTAAMQTADSNTGLTSIQVAVYQISAVVGRGYPRNITVAIHP
jgi:hypothetical protein